MKTLQARGETVRVQMWPMGKPMPTTGSQYKQTWEACCSLNTTQANTEDGKTRRTRGSNGPHIVLQQDSETGQKICVYTRQRGKQLVLIIGLIFRRKRRWWWGGGLSSAPHEPHMLLLLWTLERVCVLPLVTASLLGGLGHVCRASKAGTWQSAKGLESAKQKSHWGPNPCFDTAKTHTWKW